MQAVVQSKRCGCSTTACCAQVVAQVCKLRIIKYWLTGESCRVVVEKLDTCFAWWVMIQADGVIIIAYLFFNSFARFASFYNLELVNWLAVLRRALVYSSMS